LKLKRFGFRVKTLWQFLKFGFTDFWFDFYYAERLLIWKLYQMSELFYERGVCQESQKIAMEIRYYARLLDYITNYYETDIHMNHSLQFPNKPEKIFVSEKDPESGFYTYKASEELKEYRLTDEGRLEEQRERELLLRKDTPAAKRSEVYRLIGEKIHYWWD